MSYPVTLLIQLVAAFAVGWVARDVEKKAGSWMAILFALGAFFLAILFRSLMGSDFWGSAFMFAEAEVIKFAVRRKT